MLYNSKLSYQSIFKSLFVFCIYITVITIIITYIGMVKTKVQINNSICKSVIKESGIKKNDIIIDLNGKKVISIWRFKNHFFMKKQIKFGLIRNNFYYNVILTSNIYKKTLTVNVIFFNYQFIYLSFLEVIKFFLRKIYSMLLFMLILNFNKLYIKSINNFIKF